MESPVAMLEGRRERCAGIVKQRYNGRGMAPLFEVHAVHLEPRQMAGWHTAAELRPWKRGAK
jgi:hypothetical protein